MVAFLSREIDIAEAMIYNEYAQVLEATNPETGELYKPEDLNVFNWNDFRSSMLQDAIFVREGVARRGRQPRHRAPLRPRVAPRLDLLPRQPGRLRPVHDRRGLASSGAGHQAWMMNEINALVWPSPLGVGMMDRSVEPDGHIAKQAGIIKDDPAIDAYRTDLVEEALAASPRTRRARASRRARSRSPRAATDFASPSQTQRAGPSRAGPLDSCHRLLARRARLMGQAGWDPPTYQRQ